MPEPEVQRQVEPEEEETLQSKPLASQITPLDQVQRQEKPEEEEETLQAKPLADQITPLVQRQEEAEELEEEDEEDEEALQGKFTTSETPAELQSDGGEAENPSDMPRPLKAGLEQLSGMELSGVRVHNNSSKPAQLNALAYTQGQDIHMGPGQEKYLPHEGWHVVQQMQGRVRPTMHAKGVSINDDSGLEREADAMGEKALQPVAETKRGPAVQRMTNTDGFVIQRASPLSDAVRLIQANSSTTGAGMITEDLVTGIRQAENMFLKERPFNRWGGSLGLSDTVGPGQLGEPAITDVDRNFGAAATAFAAIHGATPSDWRTKATDAKWSYFYIAGYLAYSINRAESIFHPAPP
ncbi:MAG: DUF4157 domain-containing protein, partial [Candidatus Omnitrophica bacterium]|nr:DUF4157 domain-containing protein [Candidatus Omnitrophota bacterium]